MLTSFRSTRPKAQYNSIFDSGANGFTLAWPSVENFRVSNGATFGEYYQWINDQKAPLAKT
jgi:hypothetical protein